MKLIYNKPLKTIQDSVLKIYSLGEFIVKIRCNCNCCSEFFLEIRGNNTKIVLSKNLWSGCFNNENIKDKVESYICLQKDRISVLEKGKQNNKSTEMFCNINRKIQLARSFLESL